jgi:uncharacterized membrane protein YidH (DUF202 family)
MTEISPDARKQDEKEKAFSMEETGRRLVYFAAERTLLTWIRIALTLMGLGFIIDRFSLILNQTVILIRDESRKHGRSFYEELPRPMIWGFFERNTTLATMRCSVISRRG